MRGADECQKVLLPSASSQVSNFNVASSLIGRLASQTCPFTFALKTFLANPSEIDFAISIAAVPSLYWRTDPSGKLILIILYLKYLFKRKTRNIITHVPNPYSLIYDP